MPTPEITVDPTTAPGGLEVTIEDLSDAPLVPPSLKVTTPAKPSIEFDPATPEPVTLEMESDQDPEKKPDDLESAPYAFPLNTRMSELYAFQDFLVAERDKTPFAKDTNKHPLGIDWLTKKVLNPKYVISQMDFETYFKFRNFQIQQMQKVLTERLSLLKSHDLALESDLAPNQPLKAKTVYLSLINNKITYKLLDNNNEEITDVLTQKDFGDEITIPKNGNLEDFENIKQHILTAIAAKHHKITLNPKIEDIQDESWSIPQKITNRIGLKDSFEDRKTYLEAMLKLLDGVSITAAETNDGKTIPNIMNITKNGKTLVTIKENTRDNLNNMEFEIPPEILKYNPNEPKEVQQLETAIELMMDQTTRMLERNNDKDRKLFIEGYDNSPEMVIRMFYSARLHELKPTIDPETIKIWKTKAAAETDPDPDKNRYTKALAQYEKINKMKLQDLKKLAAKDFSLKYHKVEKPAAKLTPIKQK